MEELRLVVGLAHATPRAILQLISEDGQTYTVSDHPGSDFTSCELRRMMSISLCPSRPNFVSWIKDFEVTGSVEYKGGGIFQSEREGISQRIFSTLLRPELVFDLLDATDIEGISQEPVDAVLTPDPILGVTTITISVGQSTQESELDELAVIAHSACLVKEMSLSLDRQSSGTRYKASIRKDSDFPN